MARFWGIQLGLIIGVLTLSGFDRVSSSCADERRAAAKTKEIPRKLICCTDNGDGMQQLSVGAPKIVGGTKKYTEPYGFFLHELRKKHRDSSSNVILVRGDDITAAVRGTYDVFLHGRHADKPVTGQAQPPSKRHWVAAYLGMGVAGPRWTLKTISRTGNKIQVAYSERKQGLGIQLLVYHYYWAPLGELEAGDYLLELFDVDRTDWTLQRRVKVN